MAAKSAYIEKIGAVYYVRKRIPRAWEGGAGGGMLRLSLRTKERAAAMRLGALIVFEELSRMDTSDALKHLLERLIDEQLLAPEAMTDDDLIRRRALGAVGAKLIRRGREEFNVNVTFPSLFEEVAHSNHATVKGEERCGRAVPHSSAEPIGKASDSNRPAGDASPSRLIAFPPAGRDHPVPFVPSAPTDGASSIKAPEPGNAAGTQKVPSSCTGGICSETSRRGDLPN